MQVQASTAISPEMQLEPISPDTKCVYCGHTVTIPFKWEGCDDVVDYHCAVDSLCITPMKDIERCRKEAFDHLGRTPPSGKCPQHLETCGKLQSVGFVTKEPVNRFQLRTYRFFPTRGYKSQEYFINPNAIAEKITFATNYLTFMMAKASGQPVDYPQLLRLYNLGEVFLGFKFLAPPTPVTHFGPPSPLNRPYVSCVYFPKVEEGSMTDNEDRIVRVIMGEAANPARGKIGVGKGLTYSDKAFDDPDCFKHPEFYAPRPPPPAPTAQVEPIEINCVPSEMHCLPSEPVKCCTIL